MHYRSPAGPRAGTSLLALLLLGTTTRCAQPACERDPLGCQIPVVTIQGAARLSLSRDVTLQLNIRKQFYSSPTALRVVQSTATPPVQLRLNLQCTDLTACPVTVTSADLKASGFTPGDVELTVLDAPDATTPLASVPQPMRIDDPQFVFVSDGGYDAGDGWPLPAVPTGMKNQGLRWMSTIPTAGSAQGILARAALDSGNYEVNSLYVATYNAISRDFTLTPRSSSIVGKSAFYSDPSFLWHLTRVNGAAEEYNLAKIDLRNINGSDITLRNRTALQGPPLLLAVTPDGVQAAIADATQAVSHFSTGGAEPPVVFSSDPRPVLALQGFMLITTPEIAVINADRVRLYDTMSWLPLAASAALNGLTMPGPITTMSVADLNGDSLRDLLVPNGLRLTLWGQKPDHTFALVNYLQLPAVSSPCPDNPELKTVRTVRGLASGELDGQAGVDLMIATEDSCEQLGTPLTTRLFVFLHGS